MCGLYASPLGFILLYAERVYSWYSDHWKEVAFVCFEKRAAVSAMWDMLAIVGIWVS